MGVKNTEYQHSYKSSYPRFTKVYESNVGYRALRRSTEHNHHVEPFDWDLSSEDSDRAVAPDREIRTAPALPRHVRRHEKFNRNYHDRLAKLSQQFEKDVIISERMDGAAGDEAPDSARSRDSGVQTDQVVHVDRAVNGSVEVYPREEKTDVESQAQPAVRVKVAVPKPKTSSKYPRKPVPKPRPMSAPADRSLKREVKQKEQPPFVPYGFKDREVKLGTQKTYNIRASAEIYPSALLARKRRLAEIARREQQAKAESLAQKRKRALFNDFHQRLRRETTEWDTEYRRHYAGYERGIYEQALARPISRQHDPQLLVTTW